MRKRLLELAKREGYKVVVMKDGSLKIKVKVLVENKVTWMDLAVFTTEQK